MAKSKSDDGSSHHSSKSFTSSVSSTARSAASKVSKVALSGKRVIKRSAKAIAGSLNLGRPSAPSTKAGTTSNSGPRPSTSGKAKGSIAAPSNSAGVSNASLVPQATLPVEDNTNKTVPEIVEISDGEEPLTDAQQKKLEQAEFEKLRSRWTSVFYSFFKEASLRYDGERKYHWFPCGAKVCKNKGGPGVRRYLDTGDKTATSSLKIHAITCWGSEAVTSATTAAKEQGRDGSVHSMFARLGQRPVKVSHRTHTNSEIRAHLVRWITENHRPLRIVKDRELQDLLLAGRPGAEIPSPQTVAEDIKESFAVCKERIAKLLHEYPGKLSFATDAWTSPNHRAFVAWTVHLQHEGHPLVFLLDIMEVPVSHTGVALAKAFDDMLAEFGIREQILSFTGDNASSNDTQTTRMSRIRGNSFQSGNRVRCFNHTLQLACKALLVPFTAKKKRKATSTSEDNDGDSDSDDDDDIPDLEDVDEGDDDDDMDDLVLEEDEDSEEDDESESEEFDGMDEAAQEEIMADTEDVREALSKIRKLAFAIVHSTTIALPEWRRICAQLGLPPRLIPRDVATRWNSTFDMLVVAKEYAKAVDNITAQRELKLRKYELSLEEWGIIDNIITVLKIFKDATIFFSSDSHSTVANVIPTMDRIDDMLNSDAPHDLHVSVKAALLLARNIIDKYSSKTEQSNIYRTAMILHPGVKLEYFRVRQWPSEDIEAARKLVHTIYSEYEERRDLDDDNVETSAPEKDVGSRMDVDDYSLFQNISVTKSTQKRSELDNYLAAPLEQVKDPLLWWWEKRMIYPTLSQMALDYHSVPATSTAVERVFSQGRHLLHFTRNRLAPRSIRAFLCLGAWSRRDMVRNEDILTAIKSKGAARIKRKRADTIADEPTENIEDNNE